MRIFVITAALFGAAFVFVTPPLEVPDEAAHYWRACAIAHGTLQPAPQYGQGYTAIQVGERELGIAGGKSLQTFRAIPYVSERVIVRYPLSLSPLPFLPQAIGIAIGNVVHLRPLYSFYLGRLLNLACALTLIVLAARQSRSPSVLYVCALLPMTLFMFASFSPDAMSIAMTFLAMSLALAGSPWVIAATIGVALCKPYLLIPLVALATRQRWATAATVIAGGFVSSLFAHTSASFMRGFVNEHAQVAFIEHHPLRVLATIARDLGEHAWVYTHQMIGILGWLTIPLPRAVIVMIILLLVVVAATAGPRLTRAQRIAALIVAVASIITVELSEYISWTAVGASVVEGVQGRYFIPILPLLLIGMSRPSIPPRWLHAIIALVMTLANGVALAEDAGMAARVRAEFLRSWKAYEQYAWGHDELRPLSKTPRDWSGGQSLMITPVDALDTLLLMGFNDEAEKAKALIVTQLSFDKDIEVKNFEITIRVLGGLLSAYEMTRDERLLHLADDLGTRLLPVFDSPTGMPYMFVNLRTGKTRGARSNPAEIGTLLLEFGTLSKLTHKPVYFDKAKNAVVQLYKRRSKIGLVGEEIDVESGDWTNPSSHIGGAIDSYYEYLLKSAILFGDNDCETMWRESKRALSRYVADGAWYGTVDMNSGKRISTDFGALQAFFPAVLVLDHDLRRARRLQASAFAMWKLHGIEPEAIDYKTMKVLDARYPLRPEIIESAYYLRDEKMGRVFFDDLYAYCRTDIAYTTLKDVVTKEKSDLMPSYFLAETLKYLWLIFSPAKTIDLNRVVFNTEAHPLQR